MAEHIQQEIFDIIAKFVGQKNIIPIPVEFVRFTGDYNTAALLTQIIYWIDRTKDPEGWIYKTYGEWEEELALSEYQIRRATNNLKGKCKGTLKDKCMLKTKVKKVNGNPTVHYALNIESFVDHFVPFLKSRRGSQTVVSLVSKETILEKLQKRIFSFSENETKESTVSINTETTSENTTATTTESASISDCGKISDSQKNNNEDESQSQSLSSDFDTEYDTLVNLVPEPMRKSVIINLIGKYHRSHGFRHVADCIVHTNQRPKREGNETWQAYRGYLAKGLAGHYEGIEGMYESFSDKEDKEKEPTEAELLAISIRNGEKRFLIHKEKEYEITDEGYVYDFEIPDESGMIYKYMLTAEQIAKIVMAGKGTLR